MWQSGAAGPLLDGVVGGGGEAVEVWACEGVACHGPVPQWKRGTGA